MDARKFSVVVLLAVCVLSAEAKGEPPGDMAESSLYPIRIFYESSLVGEVPGIMAEAEDAWADLIVDAQLPPPLTLFGTTVDVGFDIVLDTAIPGLSTYEVVGDHPGTTTADCPTLAWFNPSASTSNDMLTMTIHHLLARQCLRAVDCIEPFRPAYDMFAVAYGYHYMGLDHPYWLSSELPVFQSMPWESIDYVGSGMEVYYAYGSALFTLFLDEMYGAADGALLKSIWERTAQDGTILTWLGPDITTDVDNEPDFLDAIAAELEDQASTFNEAFIEFVEWRFFIGADDDGAHSDYAPDWAGGEVARDAELTAADLPMEDADCANPVAEYGANYIEIDLAGLDPEIALDFTFNGNKETCWWVGLFLIPPSGAATVQPFDMTDDYSGEYTLEDPAVYERIVIAIANLSDGDHDGDASDWTTAFGDFTYSITDAEDPEDDAGTNGDTDAGADAGSSGGNSGCGCRSVDSGNGKGSLLELLFHAWT
jgi:hypothetical protein